MSPRAFQALLWSTCAAALAAFWLARADALPDASRVAGDASVAPFGARVADVAKIIVEGSDFSSSSEKRDYSLTLERRGQDWVASDRGDYPARPAAVAGVLSGLSAMRLLERKTAKADNFRELGVEDRAPGAGSTALTFEFGNGAKAGGVLVGKRSGAASFDQTGATFVRRAGERQAWLAQGSAGLPRDFAGWFNELPAIPATDVQKITISEGGKVVFEAKKNDEGLYSRSDAEEPAANDTAVKRVAQAMVGTGFEDVKPQSVIATPARLVRLEMMAGGYIEVAIGDVGGQTFVRYEGTATGNAGDLVKRAKGYAYKLPGYRISGLAQTVEALTAPEPPASPPGGFPGMMPQPGGPGPQGGPPPFPPGFQMPPGGLPPGFQMPQGGPPRRP